jgi:hypothetical protein
MATQPQLGAKIRNGVAGSIDARRDLGELQNHLKEITEGDAFRGSQRSAQFLKYIVDRALAGDLDSLKERSIGIQLFRRTPTYDTGAGAIVRLAASDVRKRLLHHYEGGFYSAQHLKIGLPPGSYVPEITYSEADILAEVPPPPAAAKTDKVDEAKTVPSSAGRLIHKRWFIFVAVIAFSSLVVIAIFGRSSASANSTQTRVIPWSVLSCTIKR